MSLTVTKDHVTLANSVAEWGERHGLRAAARAEVDLPAARRPRGLPGWWSDAVTLELPGLALPPAVAGAGAGVEELGVVLAELGHQVAPGPLAPSAAAGLVLLAARRHEPDPAFLDTLLAGVAAGTAVLATALDGSPRATRTSDGYRVSGDAGLVLGAQHATALLIRAATADGERWLVVDVTDRVSVDPIDSLDVTRPPARVTLSDAVAGRERMLAGVDAGLVRDLCTTTAAAEAAGIARWAQETATAYAKVREQFGRPIGSFQSVKHLCADMLARSELAAAAAWDAATAATAYLQDGGDDARHQLAIAAGAAGAVALPGAVDNSKDCIQVLGGIGMTWEHDAHLGLRRAMVLRMVCGGTGWWRLRTTQLTRSGVRRRWSVPLGEEARDIRSRIRETIGRLPADEPARRIALADEGLIAPHWPKPHGLGASPVEQLVIAEELARAGVRVPDLVVGNWALPTIIQFGTDAQRERFVAPTLRGELVWCQLFSEPGAGSDLASVRTRAARVPGGWSLTGQKVWTSMARESDWGICLARTDPDAPNHHGISYFLVDMKAPGFDIRPLREITGDAIFNEVFLDDVFVPDDMVVGDVNRGWGLARATLAAERVAIASTGRVGAGLAQLVSECEPEPLFDERVGELLSRNQVAQALAQQITLRRLDGLDPGPTASIRKLVMAHLGQDVAELALTIMGTRALDLTDERVAARVHAFMLGRAGTIAGGSSQIQRNIIAERLLGLPRD